MNSAEQNFSAIAYRARQWEVLAGLDRAFDLAYRRLRRAARKSWQGSFAGLKDPSDACVRVKLATSTPLKKAVRGSGFLTPPSKAARKQQSKVPLPGFAH